MTEPKLAPEACIVCGKKGPGLTYFAGVEPVGAMACQGPCTETVLERVKSTGRADGKHS